MSRYLIDERPLIVQPTLVKVFGLEQALILQQFHWLLGQPRTGIDHDGRKWIWGSYEQWCEDYFPFWPPRTLRYHVNKLQKTGVIITKALRQADWDRTNYYTIDYTKLDLSIGQHLAPSTGQPIAPSTGQPIAPSTGQPIAPSIYGTEKTTEKTTERARANPVAPPVATPGSPPAPSPAKPLRLPNDGYDMPSNGSGNGTAESYRDPTHTQLKRWAPRIDPRKFHHGYIPAGAGETPTEVWYESFPVADAQTRLTAPDQDDLRHCDNLAKLRQIVVTYRRCDFKRKKNIQLVLDWYRDGIPAQYQSANAPTGAGGPGGAARRDLTYKEWLLDTYHTTFAAHIKPESELQDEYKQWRRSQGLPPGI